MSSGGSPGPSSINAARSIDLDDRTVDALSHWRHDHATRFDHVDPDHGLLVRDDGQPINPQSISQGFDRAVVRTGLPKLTLHGLRHTHATLLLKAGVPLKVVSERLGHATPVDTGGHESVLGRGHTVRHPG